MSKKEAKATGNTALLNVISGISQALANAHDGALDEDGKPFEIGLKREVENYITTSRQMDGFSARVQGKILIVSYQAEILMKDVHDKKFESDIEGMFADIIKFLKKQYKIFTKNALRLKEKGKASVKVETVSRQRTWVVARKLYEIGGIDVDGAGDDQNKKLEKAVYKWLENSTDKKPKNVKISKSDNEKE